jgi:uracil permease
MKGPTIETVAHSGDYRFHPGEALLGAQMLFVAFGALILVPLLTGFDPNVALFTAGAGTLVFQAITGGRIPVFLASSFAFIPAMVYGAQTWGIPSTLSGLAAAGLLYVALSQLVRWRGVETLQRVLPPVVTGPVIMVIGLMLAETGVNMAMGRTGDGTAELVPYGTALLIAGVSLGATILATLRGRGMLHLASILVGVATGYAASLLLGLVDFSAVRDAAWFAVPKFVAPEWNTAAVLYILPVAIAPAIEHFGDVLAIGSVTGRDYLRRPGIHRTMLGDGVATSLASALGGPPNTTYSEVTGAVALTGVRNPAVMTWAALFAIALAFVGKLGALLTTLPVPVIGGILILLFGVITVVGIDTLARDGTAILEPRNLIIVALVLVSGVGGLEIGTDAYSLSGIGLAGVIGVLANLALPRARGA